MKRVEELGISPWPWYKRVRFDVNELVGTDEYGHTQIVLTWTDDVINKKTPNNARLIAAAPEMYECLRRFYDLEFPNGHEGVSGELLNLAIATKNTLAKAKRKLSALHTQRLGKFHDSYLRIRDFRDDETATSEIWDACGRDLREIMGWDAAKSMHNLRKDSTDQVYQNMGIDEACEFSSDTEKIIREHYAGKKRIDPRTISIAKM